MKPKIIVHGGARNDQTNENKRQADVSNACQEAYKVLCRQGALDAVEQAIKQMESSLYLNAGIGSYLQLDGRVRMDAAIMNQDMTAGSVIGIEDVAHPISVARRLMEATQHVSLAGTLATEFAHSEGFPRYDPRTRGNVELWLDIMEEIRTKTSYEQLFHVDRRQFRDNLGLGTVGCVAIDAKGNLAAGTSTGGLRMNVPGRVGDSGIIGAGTYCSLDAGVSCTGVGEKIMVICLAKEVANYLKYNANKQAKHAASYAIELLESIRGTGGLICIDGQGRIGYAFNTKGMTLHFIE
jgi:beta-aspartyl-peptidase (threonine type)